ncbi:MAG: CoA-binding protein, partial [Brevundimonas sp.]
FMVNPHARSIRSTLCYSSVAALPVTPDLAVVATPAATVPGLIRELGARGCRMAVVLSAGFEAGGALRQTLRDAAAEVGVRIVGPNCLGILSPVSGVNASFAPLPLQPGGLAVVAQSGAVTTAVLDWASRRRIGFSRVVTLGDTLDLDFADLLGWLADDPLTETILLYVESIVDARVFMRQARRAAQAKPVLVIKAGQSRGGAKAAFSHTGALAGSDEVYAAAFRQAGLLRLNDLRAAYDVLETFRSPEAFKGSRLAILTNGGGAGVMAVDALERLGGSAPTLGPAVQDRLRARLPAAASLANPVDILGDAHPDRYRDALEALSDAPDIDGALVLNCPTAVSDGADAARAVAESAGRVRAPLLTAWLGGACAVGGRDVLVRGGVPTFETPEEAVAAFMARVSLEGLRVEAGREPLLQADPAETTAARRLIEPMLKAGRAVMTDPEARALLAVFGIPVIESRTVATPAEAGQAAVELAGPVALKILSADLTHKTDVGGVVLDLRGGPHVEAAAAAMRDAVRAKAPQARLDGFIVEAMAPLSTDEELLAGLIRDPVFGPVVLVGRGGIAVEIEADHAMALAPLDTVAADALVRRTRVSRRLDGYRGRPPADRAALNAVLAALSRLALACPEVAELDINPLRTGPNGVLAMDARLRLAPVPSAAR